MTTRCPLRPVSQAELWPSSRAVSPGLGKRTWGCQQRPIRWGPDW